MKLISFKRREDYGTELYVQVLHTKRWALLQASVSWNDFPGWPYIQIKSGTETLLSIMFCAYKFGFDIGFCEHTWNFEYLEDPDVDEEDETTTR
jgi:hypothetical protein